MKQQVNPIVAIVAVVGALAVIGLVIWIVNSNKPASAGAPPPVVGQSPAAQAPVRNMSPDDTVKAHMKQMQQGGGQ